MLAALNHPNIAQIHGLENRDGTIALVMELVEGPTLADRIAQGPIPVDEALPIAKQIAEALEAAHERGIIHRDLKPANIKVRPDGTVKVLDFGLAKALDSSNEQNVPDVPGNEAPPYGLSVAPTATSPALMTGVGVLLGTAAYMSPEQARGNSVDERADIWAFGCVLYEMLTGRQAFPGNTISDSIASILTKEPDWTALPPATPTLLRRLLRRCLVKNARERLHDMSDVRLDLADAFQPSSDAAPHLPPPVAAMPRWWFAVALVAALVAGGALTAAILRVMTEPPTPTVTRLSIGLSGTQALVVGGLDRDFALSPDGLASCTSAPMDRSCSCAGWIRWTPHRLEDWVRHETCSFRLMAHGWVSLTEWVRSRRLR